MKQEERLLQYLESGKTINPLQSWQELGIYRLSDVVLRLKRKGHDIITERKGCKNRFGEKCNFGEYRLVK
jgi:hypothetical protein